MTSRRSLRIEPTIARDILNGEPSSAALPTAHVDSPTSAALRSNRFSISFPVQPSALTDPGHGSQSPVREAAGEPDTNFLTAIAAQERRVLELKEELIKAEGDLNKLKKQWAQHEAQKKKNDARSLTKLQPLQTSLPDVDSAAEDTDGSSAWMQQEMERRKALLSSTKPSNRTVFSGSKHARTLSLLSPVGRTSTEAQRTTRPDLPARKESLPGSTRRSQDSGQGSRPKLLSRAATASDVTSDVPRSIEPIVELVDAGMDRDVLIEASKKVANGLRDGLWTFWEDLRQATVGEESEPIPPPRRQSSTQTLKAAKKQSSMASLRPSSRGSAANKISTDTKKPSPSPRKSKSQNLSLGSTPALADPSFWTEHGMLLPTNSATPVKKAPAKPKHRKSTSKATAASIESTDTEAWDTWDDSPQNSRSSSAISEATTIPSTASDGASPRTSADTNPETGDDDKVRSNRTTLPPGSKDPLPWPALSNLGPKALRRTASHLMSEWERSLTSSPVKEYATKDDYMGLGTEVGAADTTRTQKND